MWVDGDLDLHGKGNWVDVCIELFGGGSERG